jgi:hypothetical protein
MSYVQCFLKCSAKRLYWAHLPLLVAFAWLPPSVLSQVPPQSQADNRIRFFNFVLDSVAHPDGQPDLLSRRREAVNVMFGFSASEAAAFKRVADSYQASYRTLIEESKRTAAVAARGNGRVDLQLIETYRLSHRSLVERSISDLSSQLGPQAFGRMLASLNVINARSGAR